ncbi:unannotated protein [freshwater metagenome]|uniref:Unannotated protein n=1 Tax=freshwater metagenome TaxID=449393 RepID=A0A6J7IDW5_9ZZZZ
MRGELSNLALGPDVEPDDDRLRCAGQGHVVLRDRADASVNDTEVHLLADIDLQQRILECLDGTRNVALDDEGELGDLALFDRLEEVLERALHAVLREERVALSCLTCLGNLTGDAILGNDEEAIAGTRHRRKTEYLDGERRTGDLDGVAVVVEHCPDSAVGIARDDRIAGAQGAALDEDGRHRAAAAVEMSLDRDALGILARVGAQVERRIGREEDGIEKLLDTGTRLRGDVDEHRVAAELLSDESVLSQLGPDLNRVCAFLVDLVHCHDDRHAGRLRMVQGLDCLRLHAIISSNDKDRDVGDLRTTGAHGGERLMARGIDEGDLALALGGRGRDLVGADVLRDPTCLATDDVRLADSVKETGLAVIDVTHDRDNRRTDDEVFLDAFVLAEFEVVGLEQFAILILGGYDLDVVVELTAEQAQRVVINRLSCRHHLAELDEHLHEVGRHAVHLVGEVGQARASRKPDGLARTTTDAHAAHRRGLHIVELLTLRTLGLATTRRPPAGPSERSGRRATSAGSTRTSTLETTGTTGTTARSACASAGGSGTTRTTWTATLETTGTATRPTCTTRTARATALESAGASSGATRASRTSRGPRGHSSGIRTGYARHARRSWPRHAGAAAERIVARPRGGGAAHAGAAAERVVAGPGPGGSRSTRRRARATGDGARRWRRGCLGGGAGCGGRR